MSETKFNSYKTKSCNINTLDRELSIMQHPQKSQNDNFDNNNFMENFDNMSIQSNRFMSSDKMISEHNRQIRPIRKNKTLANSRSSQNNLNLIDNNKKQMKNILKPSTTFNPLISPRPNSSIESNTRYIPYISPRPSISKRLSPRELSSTNNLSEIVSQSKQITKKKSKQQIKSKQMSLSQEFSKALNQSTEKFNESNNDNDNNDKLASRQFNNFNEDFSDTIPMKKYPTENKSRIKYVSTSKNDFKEFFSFGNKLGQNYNTEMDNDLRFSESTRRKTLAKELQNKYKMSSTDETFDNLENKQIDQMSNIETMNNINTMTNIKSQKMSIDNNEISDTAAKIPKSSAEYWDNTKRRNLDTAIYTNNPNMRGGRGFGNVEKYDLYLNNVGLATRQDNPDDKPRNVDEDRIFLTNHNYNYDKFHVTETLPCGQDTRYLNKKMI
jgi:hypothetical protein